MLKALCCRKAAVDEAIVLLFSVTQAAVLLHYTNSKLGLLVLCPKVANFNNPVHAGWFEWLRQSGPK